MDKDKRIAELEAALQHITNVLGENACSECNCEGCAWEMGEAFRSAEAALEGTGEHPDSVRLKALIDDLPNFLLHEACTPAEVLKKAKE